MSNKKNILVSIIMGSQSDWEFVKPASKILKEFSILHESKIISAHRTPSRLDTYAKHAEDSEFKVIIAGAGGGIQEAVLDQKTGILIPLDESGDVNRKLFITAIKELVKDKELRKQYGNMGRKRCVELFSVDTTNIKIIDIIRGENLKLHLCRSMR